MDIPRTSTSSPDEVLPFDIDSLKAQQSQLAQQGRMHWVHWLIIALSAVITVLAWSSSRDAVERQEHFRFEREAERVLNLIQERIAHYEDALLSGVAAMQTHEGRMSKEQWQRYASFLKLPERYPGVNGIGVIRYVDTLDIPGFVAEIRQQSPNFSIHPEHPYDLSLPITYIEPEAENAAALGLDVAFEGNRRSAALVARATNTTQISGPIVLVQDDQQTPGFLFYAPYYDHEFDSSDDWTESEREQYFEGLVYAPLVMRNLVAGVLSAENRAVSFSIHDGEVTLYQDEVPQAAPAFSLTRDVDMNGRTWRFDIVSSNSVASFDAGVDQPTLVLVSALALEAMLFGLFWSMSRSNRRTLAMAETMTSDLIDQAQTLAMNNRDLQSFAHVVSHDLKTPMRNIHSVLDILDEDFRDFLASNDEGAEIKLYLTSLQDQALRGESLIDGILEYSTLSNGNTAHAEVDTHALVTTIGTQQGLADGQLSLAGTFPFLTTNVTLLEQVLSNLIGNALKYNPDKVNATVLVSAHRKNGECCFSVEDNGPGIEAHFHERIFEPFMTLSNTQDLNSSGIGLSIVQRAVELQGGTITVESAPGQGSIFRFTWPESPGRGNSRSDQAYG